MLYFVHNALHQSGFTFAVLTHESHLVTPFDGERSILEDLMLAVGLPYSIHNDGIVTASGRRRKFQTQSRSVFFIYFNDLKLFEHLHTALHLQGLAIRTLEALDEVLGFLNHLLLFFVLLLLLLTAFLTENKVLRIVHLIVIDASHGHFDGTGGDAIDKLTVVTDDDDRLGTVNQEIFQPLDGLDVEVIGRLVEQEHIGILKQELRQLDTHTPTATELAGRFVEVFAQETQTEQGLLHIFLEVSEVDGIELLAHSRYLFDERHIFIALVVGTFGQFLVDGFYFGLHLMKVGESLRCLLEHGASVFGHQVLRKIGHDTIFRCRHLPTGRLTYTCQDFQQG